MRYQVPVTVTLRANSTDEARRAVQRLVDEAPTAHHVYGVDGWRFAIGDPAEAQVLRTDQRAQPLRRRVGPRTGDPGGVPQRVTNWPAPRENDRRKWEIKWGRVARGRCKPASGASSMDGPSSEGKEVSTVDTETTIDVEQVIAGLPEEVKIAARLELAAYAAARTEEEREAIKARIVDRTVREARGRHWCEVADRALTQAFGDPPEGGWADSDSIDRNGQYVRTFGPDGYDRRGYDRNGRNREGFDVDGFDAEGFNREGFTRRGRDRDGYDRNGYDAEGFNREGRTLDGFDRDGYDADGFNRDGFNREHVDKDGRSEFRFNLAGYDPEGFDRDGFNREGYDRAGFNSYGWDQDGYDAGGFDRYGYNRDGKDQDGRDKYRFDRDGRDAEGFNYQGYDRDGYNREGLDSGRYDRQGVWHPKTD